MVVGSGIHFSFHWHFYYQIIYGKFDLKIFYLQSYEKTVCHFKYVSADYINWAIYLFDWESTFYNLANEQVISF